MMNFIFNEAPEKIKEIQSIGDLFLNDGYKMAILKNEGY